MIQTKFFKYAESDAANKFLLTAHLYHTEQVPAITFKEEGVVIVYQDAPGALEPFVATETVYSAVRGLRSLLIEDELVLRQFGWRIEKKRARVAEIEKEKEPLEEELAQIVESQKTYAKNTPQGKELASRRNEISKKLQKLNEELNGTGPKNTGLVQEIENDIEHNREVEKKMADRKRDIDAGLAFIKELESGTYKIHAQ